MVLVIIAAKMIQTATTQSLASFTYQTVEALLTNHPIPTPVTKSPTHGVFVTIESNGQVLGCRGTLEPSAPTLELEIQRAARSATQFDPRYHRIQIGKKPYAVTLTIVERKEALGSIATLRPEEGLILRSAKGVGVVLPWEGKDPATRLTWAYAKAKTPNGTTVSLERLIAQRYRYPDK